MPHSSQIAHNSLAKLIESVLQMSRRSSAEPSPAPANSPAVEDLMAVAGPRSPNAAATASDVCAQIKRGQSLFEAFTSAYREVHSALNVVRDTAEITEARKQIDAVAKVTNQWTKGEEKTLPKPLLDNLLAADRMLEQRKDVPADQRPTIRERVFQQWRSGELEIAYRTIERHTELLRTSLSAFNDFLATTPELKTKAGFQALKKLTVDGLTALNIRDNLAGFDSGQAQANSGFEIERAFNVVVKGLRREAQSLHEQLRGQLSEFGKAAEGKLLSFLVYEMAAQDAKAKPSRGSSQSFQTRADSAWASLMGNSESEIYAALGRLTHANLAGKSFEDRARQILGQKLPQRQVFITLASYIGPEQAEEAVRNLGSLDPNAVSERINALRTASPELGAKLLQINPHLLTLDKKSFDNYAGKLGAVIKAWDAYYIVSDDTRFVAADRPERLAKPALLAISEHEVLDAYRLTREIQIGPSGSTPAGRSGRPIQKILAAAQQIWDGLPKTLDRDLVFDVVCKGLHYEGGWNAKANPTSVAHFRENIEGRIEDFASRKREVEAAIEFLRKEGVVVNAGKSKPIYLNLGKDEPISPIGRQIIDMCKLPDFGRSVIEPRLPKNAQELLSALS